MANLKRNDAYTSPIINHTNDANGIVGPILDAGYGKGLLVYINVTAISGTTPSLTVTIRGIDPVSGANYTILQSAAITAPGLTVLRVYPGLTAVANATANDVMPPDYQLKTTIAGTTPSVTATISAAVIE